MPDDSDDVEYDLDQLQEKRDQFSSKYKKYFTIVKIIGNIGLIYTIYTKDYWISFLLWFIFFLDIDEIIRFFKKKSP